VKCGNCGSASFEVAAGRTVCTKCDADVDNETAAAIRLGLISIHKNEVIVPKEVAETVRGVDDAT
jgi:uncharacterized Zn finger protein (UPF0148 family)